MKKTNCDMENIDNKYTLIQETDWGKYIAHSENCYGEQQTMKQHSEGVARIMKSFALSYEYVDVYTYCGLLHDVGKYSKGFQKYIRAKGEKEPHAKWGAYMAKMEKSINVAFPVLDIMQDCPIEMLCSKLFTNVKKKRINGMMYCTQ